MKPPNPTETFLLEADELLVQIEERVLEIRPGSTPGEAIHHLFRAFHTIKGSGAMFGFDNVAAFTHHVESLLEKVRDGILGGSDELVNVVLAAKDHIKMLLGTDAAVSQNSVDREEQLIAALKAFSPGNALAQPGVPVPEACGKCTNRVGDEGGPVQIFHIHFRPNPALMISGSNPLMLLDELRGLGECTVVAETDAIPGLEELKPDACYFSWNIKLRTPQSANVIKDVFIFVEEGSQISVQPEVDTPKVATGSPARPEHEEGSQRTSAVPPEHIKETNSTAGTAGKPSLRETTTRVASERLDRLVTLVGEMVMNQSRLTQVAQGAGLPHLTAPVEELERLVAELRENVLGIRMMPIGSTFNRYKRLVHDLSAELGKSIDLVTEGAETELDKSVLDQLADPLVHLIRNSIDHGIESAEARLRGGKPAKGNIHLRAAHTGSNVVVTIEDDGKGLDAEAIHAKAVEKQLISSDATLTKEQIFNLIFLPGFSTAKTITSVSGRGVGMDVVRRQIEALRGSIQLASEPGEGTAISLTLPLTLAIIEGLLVEIGRDQFIIPMTAVTENVELSRAARRRQNGRNLITVRGELIPYIRLREEFNSAEEGPEIEKVVIARHGSERVGLVVDKVLGGHQTVIQSLGRFYREIQIVSGATITGDGRVALILDVGGVVRFAAGKGLTTAPAAAIKASHPLATGLTPAGASGTILCTQQ